MVTNCPKKKRNYGQGRKGGAPGKSGAPRTSGYQGNSQNKKKDFKSYIRALSEGEKDLLARELLNKDEPQKEQKESNNNNDSDNNSDF